MKKILLLFVAVLYFTQLSAETLSCFYGNIVSIKTESLILASIIISLAVIRMLIPVKKGASNFFLFASSFFMFLSSISGALIALDLREKSFFFWLACFLLVNAFLLMMFFVTMFNFSKKDYSLIAKKDKRHEILLATTFLLLSVEIMALFLSVVY